MQWRKKQDKDKRAPKARDVTLDGMFRGGLFYPRGYFNRDIIEECDKIKPFLSEGRGNSAEVVKCSFKEESEGAKTKWAWGKGRRAGQRAGQAMEKKPGRVWTWSDSRCKKIPINCGRLVKRLLEYFRIKIRMFYSKVGKRKGWEGGWH